MADQRIFNEAVFRAAVTRFEVNSDPASAQRIVTGVGQVLRMLDTARAQVKRVRDLHSPVSGLPGTRSPVCRHCVTYDGQTVPAPCPTVRALDGTEAGR